MKSTELLAAFGHLGHLHHELTKTRKERDDLARFRTTMTQRLQEFVALVKDEPEAKEGCDLIDLVKTVLIRLKQERRPVHEFAEANDALQDLDGVRSH